VGVSISSSAEREWDKRRKKEDRRMFRKTQDKDAPVSDRNAINEEKLDEQANLLKVRVLFSALHMHCLCTDDSLALFYTCSTFLT
jgi:hypothetical protein